MQRVSDTSDMTIDHRFRVSAPLMQTLLDAPSVDAKRFVSETLLGKPAVVELGREAKMAVMRALGRDYASSIADRFCAVFAAPDETHLLWLGYAAGMRGDVAPSYWALKASADAAMYVKNFGVPRMTLAELMKKHPHLAKLDTTRWDLPAIFEARPDLQRELEKSSGFYSPDIGLSASYFDLAEDAVKHLAEEAVVLNFGSLWVAPLHGAFAREVVAGTGVRVVTEKAKEF